MAKKKETGCVVDMKMFRSAEDALKEEYSRSTLPLCPSLDDKMNGGIAEGSFVLLRTLPKIGKTTLCMQAAANALKQGRFVIYCDLERRLLGSKYFQIFGLDVKNKNFLVLQSKENEPILSGEYVYETIIKMMKMPKYRGALYIIDSFSKAIPQAILDDDKIDASRRDMAPKLNTDFCKKAGNLIRTSASIVIGVQHFHVNTSGYGEKYIATGGGELIYETDITFDSKQAHPLDWKGNRPDSKDMEDSMPGQMINFNIPHNKRGAPWLSKTSPIQTYLRFGEGVYWAREAFDLLPKTGIMFETAKNRYSIILPNGTELKGHGLDNTVDLIDENREALEKVIRDYFIEKYKINYDYTPPKVEEEDED